MENNSMHCIEMKSFLKGRHGKFMGPLQLDSVDRELLLYPGGNIHLQDLHFLLRKVRTREIKRGVPPRSTTQILNTDPRGVPRQRQKGGLSRDDSLESTLLYYTTRAWQGGQDVDLSRRTYLVDTFTTIRMIK